VASYNKFNAFTQNILNGVHNFSTDTLKVMLTNTAPTAANAVKADIVEITAGNGYTAGGSTSAATVSTASGTAKLTCADVTFAASGGSVGPFRYAVLYDSTPSGGPLIGFWDNGASVTLSSGQSFTVDFDGTNGVLTIA
jgi:hypothetical protein